MKREIKFRAWNAEDKIMYEVDEMEWNSHDNSISINFGIPGCEIMQYTGLKDKNGKEIYEGDLLLITDDYYTGTKINTIEVVEWNNEYSRFDTEQRNGLDKFWTDDCEVIGNIYENQELLNE